MIADPLIQKKQEQRRYFLRALYQYSDAKEGHSIAPQQWQGLGERSDIPSEEVSIVLNFLISGGFLAYKPGSQAVALTHKGVVAVEEDSALMAAERKNRLEALPDKILSVLDNARDTLKLMQLRAALPAFKELPDADWFEALNQLRANGKVVFETTPNAYGQPVHDTFHFGVADRRRVNLSDATRINTVTLSGEVFEIAYQRKEQADNRDGVLYLFTITDHKNGRGMRHVMLYRGGPRDMYAQDYDSRIEIVRFNAIRRAFDSGTLSFDKAYEEHKYIEVKLTQSDFGKQTPATDEQVRGFLKSEVYWLGYRLSSDVERHFVRYDNEQDLEYLNISLDNLKRNLWRLQEGGYLKSSTTPGNSVATLRLIEEMESQEGKLVELKESVIPMDNSKSVFVVHGHDEAMEHAVARFLERLGLNAIILHEQPNQGRTIIEKFEAHSTNAGFAVVLLSPDDTGSAKGGSPSPRARQNVILELGYFIGKLGRNRVCALHAGDVELPSDLHGVMWVSYSGDWKLKLIQELKAADIKVNTDQL